MKIRVDKFLHAIRLYKTRSLAYEDCKLERVLVNGITSKASKLIQDNDVIRIKKHGYFIEIKVLKTIEKRLSSVLAQECYINITPEDEILKMEIKKTQNVEFREKGTGRPTKKERREIDQLKQNLN